MTLATSVEASWSNSSYNLNFLYQFYSRQTFPPSSLRLITDELGSTEEDQGRGRSVDAAYQVMRVVKERGSETEREREKPCAHPCGVSGGRNLLHQYVAWHITGAISSAALPLISFIIILLTYCTAICILRLQRSYCKPRTLFSNFLFSLSLSNIVSHPGRNSHCPICTVKRIKIINPVLVYNTLHFITWISWPLIIRGNMTDGTLVPLSSATLLPHSLLPFTTPQPHWTAFWDLV